ncbi:Arv1-domain-containing [Pyrrhoderma noxium]|uniref:Protein ARV n=1 Tax=Pyrrhoderma noxium TaxID=2282107 RepID=A0A286UA58_9AGAM|nr:Arv1-domain-containing [Pyrrhoderma noxium]
MPICTHCTHKISYLYTVYESATNLRLDQCPNCLKFADPYVEHDVLTLLLDLILLKRDVFRHLLFNRGYEPRRASEASKWENDKDKPFQKNLTLSKQEMDRRILTLRLGIILVFLDAFIRWSHLGPANAMFGDASAFWRRDRLEPLLRIFAGCIIETVAFHCGITLVSASFLKLEDILHRHKSEPTHKKSNVREELRLSHIPLTLIYSSLTKLFLLLLLALWKPSSMSSNRPRTFSQPSTGTGFFRSALEILDDDTLDREWVVRNVLGGMAAGFGLRVVLDLRPVLTTIIILVGWMVKTFVANLLSPWVTKGDTFGNVFLAYSIP